MRNRFVITLLLGAACVVGPAVAAETYSSESHSVTRDGPTVAPAPPSVSAERRAVQETRSHDGTVEHTTTQETHTDDGVTERHHETTKKTTTYE